MEADRQKTIRDRAYALWDAEGRPDDRAEEHWYRAEAELGDENRASSDDRAGRMETQDQLGVDRASTGAPVAPTSPAPVNRTAKRAAG